MDKKAAIELDNQAKEQILFGHMSAICGEANQIFRPISMFDYGIDGEIEFKGKDGKPSGKKIYVQLKSGSFYLRYRKRDEEEIFDIKNPRHLEYWCNQPGDVYLVIQDGTKTIRLMNVSEYLRKREAEKRKREAEKDKEAEKDREVEKDKEAQKAQKAKKAKEDKKGKEDKEDKNSLQVVFKGDKLDAEYVLRLRDKYI